MTIIAAATDEQWNELAKLRNITAWKRVDAPTNFTEYKNADAFFSLRDNIVLPEFAAMGKPVFINSVVDTLTDLKAPVNVLRINGWATFLNRSAWEVAGAVDENIKSIFKSLDLKITTVTDEPGFISARIIAMIINEAYFAVGDEVSSKPEIDTAMKLGTNYPYGPFEWAKLIGCENILALLQKLNLTDSRYQPADILIKEVKEIYK